METVKESFERLQQVNAVARQIVREHPREFAKSHWDGFRRAWSPNEPYVWVTIVSRFTIAGWVTQATFLFWQGIHLAVFMLFPVGVWKLRKRPVVLLWISGMMFGFTFLPGVLSDMRFRFPIDHLLIIVCAVGVMGRNVTFEELPPLEG